MALAASLPSFSTVYAFGDSLADGGNLSTLTGVIGMAEPASPPYYTETYGSVAETLFSNGPTWVQQLAIALGLGILKPSLQGGRDFAYGGAETGLTPQNLADPTLLALSLPAQLAQFQAAFPDPAANALYAVSIGSNDILDILAASGLSPQAQSNDVAVAVANEVSFIKSLIAGGAGTVLVLGVPDLGKTPNVTSGAANGSFVPSAALVAEASQLSAGYDAALTAQLARLGSAGVVYVDAYQLIDKAVADPAAYGLSNVTSPVWSGNFTSVSSGTLAAATTASQDQYLFWDSLHPTEAGQLAIVAAAEQQLGGSALLNVTDAQYTAFSGVLQGFAATPLAITGVTAAAAASIAAQTNVAQVSISDSAAASVANLASLQALAAAGKLGSIALTDNGVPTLAITALQAAGDELALGAITGNFSVTQSATGNNLTIVGVSDALGNSVQFSGSASQYVITVAANGQSVSVATAGSSDQVSAVQALQFSDDAVILAQPPGTASVTSGNITELYGAAFGRIPDVAGLAYYQRELAANPALPLTLFAQDFLASPEYAGNPAHDYPATIIGDGNFITDCYNNLLGRGPGAGDVAWYETNVIAVFLAGKTPGSAAYAAADLLAHAYVISDFSQSQEFLGDVQITAKTPVIAQHWLLLV